MPCRSVLDASEALEPQYAIFYSVNSPHPALSGLDLASSLIKRVCGDLAQKYPSIHTYSTLSPVPSFCHWAQSAMRTIEFGDVEADSTGTGTVDARLAELVRGIPAETDFVALVRLLNGFNKGKLHREQLPEKELYVEKEEHTHDILRVLLKVLEVLVIQPAGGAKQASAGEDEQWTRDFTQLRADPQFALITDHLVMHYLAAEKMPTKGNAAAALRLPLGMAPCSNTTAAIL